MFWEVIKKNMFSSSFDAICVPYAFLPASASCGGRCYWGTSSSDSSGVSVSDQQR